MITKLRTLSVAIVAVLVVSAWIASAARAASDITFGSTTGTITSETNAAESHSQVFATTAGTVNCAQSHLEATHDQTTYTELTLKATYSGCRAFGFVHATIDMNTCGYKFSGSEVARTFTLELECVKEGVTITTAGCTLHVPPQKLPGHLVAHNITAATPADLTATFTFEGIRYTETSGCPNVPPGTSPTTENGTLTGQATVTALNTSNMPVDLTAS